MLSNNTDTGSKAMRITRTADVEVKIVEVRTVSVEYEIKKVIADWSADQGEERWIIVRADEPGWTVDHYATEAEAIQALNEGQCDYDIQEWANEQEGECGGALMALPSHAFAN